MAKFTTNKLVLPKVFTVVHLYRVLQSAALRTLKRTLTFFTYLKGLSVCMFLSSLCDITWHIPHITSTKHLWIFNLSSPQKFEQQYPNRAKRWRRNARRWEHPEIYRTVTWLHDPARFALPALAFWHVKKTLVSSFHGFLSSTFNIFNLWSKLGDRLWKREMEGSEKFLSYLANYALVCAHHSQS